ncbi:MAG: hypothetical protein IKL55_04735 [Clostridia bacterium]|nr:hypothetical protein [Clostridia bacterium]
MKKPSNSKLKKFVILILFMILSIEIYMSLPTISKAVESSLKNFEKMVGQITSSVAITETKEMIREHRGYYELNKTYEDAEGTTGISDINEYISGVLEDAYNPSYGWWYSLQNNASIFCAEHGAAFPVPDNLYLQTFHIGKQDTHNGGWDSADTVGASYTDYMEHLMVDDWYKCTGRNTLTLLPANWTPEGVIPSKVSVDEYQFDWRTGSSGSISSDANATDIARDRQFIQHTLVTVDYTAGAPYFDPMQVYYFTYSNRETYRNDPAQYANWKYKNGSAPGIGENLYNAAAAVTHTLYGKITQEYGEISIVKPEMSSTNEAGTSLKTGTTIAADQVTYQVGPIYMKDYTYAWSESVKEYSGESSLDAENTADIVERMDAAEKEFYKGLICGIIEMKVELDNGTILYVDGDEIAITYSKIDENRTEFVNSYYESPSLHSEYVFPSPKSEFYINIPISSCVGATKITKITARYKWTEMDGEVGDMTGTFHDLEWTGNKQLRGCAADEYDCTNVIDGYECNSTQQTACYHTMNYTKHNFDCGTTGYCDYCSDHYDTPSVCNGGTWESDTKYHKGSLSCGKYEHTHGYGCGNWTCGYSDGEYLCGYSSHEHDDSCYHECDDECPDSCEDDGELTCSTHVHDGCARHWHKDTASNHSCCGKYEHTHVDWSNANSTGCYGTKTFDTYCPHGFDGSEHTCGKTEEHEGSSCGASDWGDTHIGDCYGCGDEGKGEKGVYNPAEDEPSRCEHDHAFCAKCVWTCTGDTVKNAQKLNYIVWAEVYEMTIECYIENIPLVAKVEVNKYIYDVEHAKEGGNLDNSFGPSDARKELDEAVKETNPVYVETDDFITYKIVLTNESAFGVKVRVDDILPEVNLLSDDGSVPDEGIFNFISAYVGGIEITDLISLRQSIIQINAESEASLTITLQVKALEGKYENLGKIITRNGLEKDSITDPKPNDVDFIRTVDDDGPVVNHIEVQCNGTTEEPRIESSDWFILNNYNTFIDKYVYKYDEAEQIENNKLKITKETSIVDEDNVLLETRLNTNTVTENISDGNVEDKRRVDNGAHEGYKEAHPVNVEKYEKVTYAIRVSNEATDVENTDPTGKKPATQFKPTLIVDRLHNGLQYEYKSISAKIFDIDGNEKQVALDVECEHVGTEGEYEIYNITTPTPIIINPNEYIEFYMEATVVQSNMYLFAINNSAKLEKISNINDVDVTTRNISNQQETTEYIRLKDLVISGKVWLDIDKDG